jgi:uroporphyrinogen decarboxylase
LRPCSENFYNLKVAIHSCGAVSRIIPKLIDFGIDALQAKADGMDAGNFAKQFKGHIVFIGGVDNQDLLPFRSPAEVKTEVRRFKKLFGEQFIVSPSHEALLPHVSIENALAMR